MNGLVFDIQRFSVHDGPGIRTTVFLKGCPLRCLWCHNPEGLTAAPQLQFFSDACIGCGRCGTRSQLSDAEHCPTEALKVCGRRMDEEEILREVRRDRLFYGDTGGITISGGECLLQADFVASVLGRAKAEGFHTAIDTCGYVPWTSIEKTLDVCDLYLYDVKCIDPARHKAYTGVENQRILENLHRLSACNKDIWIRTPVIPGFNDSEEEMTAIAEQLAPLPSVRRVTLMPYHTLGADKYPSLGLTYPYDTSRRVSDDEMTHFKTLLESKHLTVI
jgi:pyruvate formate lyase activating enzyme